MRVLIAVEDRFFGSAVIDFVSNHNWQPGTIFKILNAVEPPSVGDNITAFSGHDVQHALLAERVTAGQKLVADTQEKLQAGLGASAAIETNVVIGIPHHVILDTAEEWKADKIILGSHGRTGFSRFLLGSVSLAVLSHATSSVVIVRPQLTAKAKDAHTQMVTAKKQPEKPLEAGAR